ncbi:MAG: metallophosphoesterase family protein [Myxococcales bacterium]
MRERTIAHLSDLHVGLNTHVDDATVRLREALLHEGVDHVVVTGDVTHRGLTAEARRFHEAFGPLLRAGKVTLVPGNHDRLNEDVRERLMPGARVQIEAPGGSEGGLYLVRVDSTGPHNRRWLYGHGKLWPDDLRAIGDALSRAPPGALRAVLLHHHVLPLPEDDPFERLVTWLGWPNAREIRRGRDLLTVLRGRCELVLHGHRHAPAEARPFEGDPLAVYNAGSTTLLERFRVFSHRGGALVGSPRWVTFERSRAGNLLPARAPPRERPGLGFSDPSPA